MSILILFILPYLKNRYSHPQERLVNWVNKKYIFGEKTHELVKDTIAFDYEVFLFWFFLIVCILLGFIGSQPMESPYLVAGRILTVLYFVYFAALYFLNKNMEEREGGQEEEEESTE